MTKTCAWGKCDREFEPLRHNQIYCCEDHSKSAARESILKRYHERKAFRDGKKRLCKCGTPLSRYNYTAQCSRCESLSMSKDISKGKAKSVFRKISDYNSNGD